MVNDLIKKERFKTRIVNEMVDVIKMTNVWDYLLYADLSENIPLAMVAIDNGRKFLESQERYEDCIVLREAYNKLLTRNTPSTYDYRAYKK